MPRPIPNRLAAACALALSLSLALCGAAGAAAKGVPVNLRVVANGGKVLVDRPIKAHTAKIRTSPRATCFGPGTGGSGKRVTIKGATAFGLLGLAASSSRSLNPLLVSDHFDFGLALCGIGGHVSTSKLSWYLKVNHRNPNLGGELVKLRRGDDVLWALAPFPYPEELELRAPRRVKPGAPFKVRVLGYDDAGKRTPVAGARVTGAKEPTGSDGRATVMLRRPARLIARHGKDIPSNREAVCVGRRCPRGGR